MVSQSLNDPMIWVIRFEFNWTIYYEQTQFILQAIQRKDFSVFKIARFYSFKVIWPGCKSIY